MELRGYRGGQQKERFESKVHQIQIVTESTVISKTLLFLCIKFCNFSALWSVADLVPEVPTLYEHHLNGSVR